jgi:hypothetical protein
MKQCAGPTAARTSPLGEPGLRRSGEHSDPAPKAAARNATRTEGRWAIVQTTSGFFRCDGLFRRRLNRLRVREIRLPDLEDVGARESASEPIRQISCKLINELLANPTLRRPLCSSSTILRPICQYALVIVEFTAPPAARRALSRSSTMPSYSGLYPLAVSGKGSLGVRFQRT